MRLKYFALILVILFLLPNLVFAEQIGWVTDIHAGSVKRKKKNATNIIHPRYYKQYFEKVAEELQIQGIDLMIISGDVTDHSRQVRYANTVKRIAEKNGIEVIWARGNHDKKSLVQNFMHQNENYYFLNRKNWRFIVLDSSERLSVKEGGLKLEQKDWLEDLLEETDENTIVITHYPIFNNETGFVYKTYLDVENWLHQSEKVKLVLAGHWHFEDIRMHNGIKYAVGNPLTLDSKIGSYYTIDLDTLWIDARQAQISRALKKKLLR